MIEKRHAIRTEDESIWIDFDGEVPRKGDLVSVTEGQCKDLEIDVSNAVIPWRVYKVIWFTMPWRKEAYPSHNHEMVTFSQARVFIQKDH